MQKFSQAIEGFVFKAFNPFGTASRSDFWLIMPLIWLLLGVFLVMDVMSVWADLKASQIPSLNPLNYGFSLLFLISWPSRLSLTMRRLNDVGRSPKWAFAPYQAALLFLWLIVGLTTAAITSGVMGETQTAIAVGLAAFGPSLIFKAGHDIWPFLFAFAQNVDLAALFHGLGEAVASILGSLHMPDPAIVAENAKADPGGTTASIAVLALLVFGPFVFLGLWLVFLCLPTRPGVDSMRGMFGGSDLMSAKTPPGKPKHNPYQAYALLAEGSQTKISEEERRAQVAALYKQRVLGRGQDDQDPRNP